MSPNLVQTSSLKSVGTMVIELCEFNDKKKKKNMDKMAKLFLVIILAISGILVSYSLVLTCAVLYNH